MKNRFSIFIIILFGIISMAMTCKKLMFIPNDTITVDNRMGETVFLFASPYYPDTTLNSLGTNILIGSGTRAIKPGERVYSYSSLLGRLPDNAIQNDTLLIFIFDNSVNSENSWEDYKDGKKYIRKYKIATDSITTLDKFIIE